MASLEKRNGEKVDLPRVTSKLASNRSRFLRHRPAPTGLRSPGKESEVTFSTLPNAPSRLIWGQTAELSDQNPPEECPMEGLGLQKGTNIFLQSILVEEPSPKKRGEKSTTGGPSLKTFQFPRRGLTRKLFAGSHVSLQKNGQCSGFAKSDSSEHSYRTNLNPRRY